MARHQHADGTSGIGLLGLLCGGQDIIADNVIGCLARADRQSLRLVCKALQEEVAVRLCCLVFRHVRGKVAEVLRSKLLPKLRGVEQVHHVRLRHMSDAQDFYRLLLALKRIGARVKDVDIKIKRKVLLPSRRSRRQASLAAQRSQQPPHDWELTADNLQQLEPVPHLEWVEIKLNKAVDAVLLQPLLRAPALKNASLSFDEEVTGGSLDLSACIQLEKLSVFGTYRRPTTDLITCLHGLQPAPSLKKLFLWGFVAHWQGLNYISSSLPALEQIELCGCRLPRLDVGAGHQLQQSFFPSLKELKLHFGCSYEQQHWIPSELALQQLFGAMAGLQRLSFTIVHGAMPRLPLDSSGLAHLEELTLSHQYPPDDASTIDGALLLQLCRSASESCGLIFVTLPHIRSIMETSRWPPRTCRHSWTPRHPGWSRW